MVKQSEQIQPQDGDSVVCLSYVPLLYSASAGAFYDPEDYLSTMADQLQLGTDLHRAKACGWMQPHEEITPVFIMERAEELVHHIKIWSEGNPNKWFTLDMLDTPDAYAICLHPKLERSADRLTLAYKVQTGKDMPKTSLRFVYVPLSFVSKDRGTLDKIDSRLGNLCHLGLIDSEKFDIENPEDSADDIIYLGPFHLRRNPTETGELLQQFIDDMLESS